MQSRNQYPQNKNAATIETECELTDEVLKYDLKLSHYLAMITVTFINKFHKKLLTNKQEKNHTKKTTPKQTANTQKTHIHVQN